MIKIERQSHIGSKNVKLDPDLIYDEIGGFGKFQLFVYTLLCVPLIFIVSCNFSYIFIASDMEYRYGVAELNYRKYNQLYLDALFQSATMIMQTIQMDGLHEPFLM